MDLFAFGADDEGDLGAVDPRAGVGLGAPGLLGGHEHQFVVVSGHGFRACPILQAITLIGLLAALNEAVLFQGLGLLAVVHHAEHLPVAVKVLEVMVGQGETGARGELRQVALGVGGVGATAQRFETNASEGLAGGIGLVAPGVVVVFVVAALAVSF